MPNGTVEHTRDCRSCAWQCLHGRRSVGPVERGGCADFAAVERAPEFKRASRRRRRPHARHRGAVGARLENLLAHAGRRRRAAVVRMGRSDEHQSRFDVLYPRPCRCPTRAASPSATKARSSSRSKSRSRRGRSRRPSQLEFAFGVCKDICIPVESKLKLSVDGAEALGGEPALKAHLARVPKVVADAGQRPRH